MTPKGVTSTVVDALVKASPDVLFLTFGRRAMLGSATMWQAVLYPPIFVRLIDKSLLFLFAWTGNNIAPHQKLAAYPHLYSFTSTKSVVHWFQIIRNRTFQMYDDEVQKPLTFSNQGKYYKVAKFPTRNIKTPIVLVYGGSDSLVDINVMLKELPHHTVAKEVPHYEHLDFLWASTVDKLVHPHVFEALEKYTNPEERRLLNTGFRMPPSSIEARKFSNFTDDSESYDSPPTTERKRASLTKVTECSFEPSPTPDRSDHLKGTGKDELTFAEAAKAPPPLHSSSQKRTSISSAAPSASQFTTKTAKTTSSRPEGWWSSDEAGGGNGEHTEPSTPRLRSPIRTNSDGTLGSVGDSTKFGHRGISVGAGRAVGGVSWGENSQAQGELTGSGGDRSPAGSVAGGGGGKKKGGRRKE